MNSRGTSDDLPFGVKESFILRISVGVSNSILVRAGLGFFAPKGFTVPHGQRRWPIVPADDEIRYRPSSPPPAVGATLVFGIPAYALFSWWMVTVVHSFPEADPHFVARMWLAGTWALIAPALIVTWECHRIGTLKTLESGCKDCHGWEKDDIARATRFADRWMYPILALAAVAVGVGYLASLDYFAGVVGLGSVGTLELVAGTVSTAWLGATFGMGIWGVMTMLGLSWAALSVEPRSLLWDPFTVRQIPGVEALSRFAYVTGILFSMGAIFLPGVLAILPDLNAIPRLVGIAISAMLIAGGLASFLIPSVWIDRTVRAQQRIAIDRLSAAMNRVLDTGERYGKEGTSIPPEAEVLIALRASILGESAAPLSLNLALRSVSLLLLPIVVSLIVSPLS